MGFFGRTMAGAGVGAGLGLMGSDRGDRLRSMGGGAAGGALAGGFGPMLGNKLMAGKGLLGQGLREARDFGAMGTAYAGGQLGTLGTGLLANKSLSATGTFARRGYGYLSAGATDFGAGLASNKWAGTALVGLGMASGANIGSSVLSSNSGF